MTTSVLEPSFVDLIAAIEQAPELSQQTRRHWICSARQIARWLDRPVEVIPARWISVQKSVAQLHHARIGVTAKTLANHKSNIRAALRWFGKEHDVPRRGMPLLASWATLRDRLDKRLRQRLYNFMRYCSARRIDPESVDDGTLEAYWRYRTETTALASNNVARRFLARTWNACASEVDGRPLQRLTEPPIKISGSPAWEHFPEGLRAELENYWDGLAKPHRSLSGQPNTGQEITRPYGGYLHTAVSRRPSNFTAGYKPRRQPSNLEGSFVSRSNSTQLPSA